MQIYGANFNYQQYMLHLKNLVETGRIPNSDSFTILNLKRMERLNKTISLQPKLNELLRNGFGKQIWYVIAESWCGDCAQNLPAIAKIADSSFGLIKLTIISRNDNPEWIERCHTNGSKSIPKLISFNSFGTELFTWGLRPFQAQQLLTNWKQNRDGASWNDFEKELHT